MPKLTFEQEAAYALDNGVSRDDISRGAQIIYDRLKAEREAGLPGQAAPVPPVPARSSPETRARILAMFKRGNRKYALPFEGNRLALASFAGGNWEEYGQIILQMAILDTLLSIEEKLSSPGVPDESS
jgi:hypothetical protein